MSPTHKEPIAWAKFSQIVATAIERLDEPDLYARMAYDRVLTALGIENIGVSMHPEGDMVRLVWGGLTLAVVEREVLVNDDVPLPDEWLPVVPDDARELTDGP